MNRRTFLASLIAIPAGIVAAVKIASAPKPWKPKLTDAQKIFFCSTPTGDDHWVYRNFQQRADGWDILCGPEQKRGIEESWDKYYSEKYGFDYKSYRLADKNRWVNYLNQIHGEKLYADIRALTG